MSHPDLPQLPPIKRFVFKPKGNKYDSLDPLPTDDYVCTVCGNKILVAIFQNDGVCSVRCQKKRDGE